MARDFVIYGPMLARIVFSNHVSGTLASGAPIGGLLTSGGSQPKGASPISGSIHVYDLGMTAEMIRVRPRLYHRDIQVDDFAQLPADILAELGECYVSLPLVQYDPFVLDRCWAEAMGGMAFPDAPAGETLRGAGTPIGGNLPAGASGNHFVGLNLVNASGLDATGPWFFPTTVLTPDNPFDLPQGAAASVPNVNFRAIPYKPSAMVGAYLSGSSSVHPSGSISSNLGTIWIETAQEVRSSGAVLVQRAVVL